MNRYALALLSAFALLSFTPACADDATRAADGSDAVDTSELGAETQPPTDGTAADTSGLPDGDASLTDLDAGDPEIKDGLSDASEVEVVDPPGARGPFNVGYRVDTVIYDPADGSGARTLRVVYWYPTRATSGANVRYLDLLPAPGVLGDAAPALDLGPRPLVVFSHGNSSFAEQSFFFTEFLASHGFVVAAMDHTGNTFAGGADVRAFHWRPKDISAVIDHLESLPLDDALEPLVGDRIAVAGHSFGGYTTLAAGGAAWDVDLILAYCADDTIPLGGCDAMIENEAIYRSGFLDPRVDALIPMAPGVVFVFGQAGLTDVALPTLLVTAARDGTTSNAEDGDPAWRQLATASADNRRIDFASAGHFTFSDACSLPLGVGVDDGCSDQFIAPATAHAAVNAYALAFLQRHLQGDERGAPLLDGALAIEPDVTLSRGGGPTP